MIALFSECRSARNAERVELENAIQLMEQDREIVLLVTAVDRFARNLKDFLNLLFNIDNKLFVIEQPQIMENELLRNIHAVVAEHERDIIIERIIRGQAQARKNGKILGWQRGRKQTKDHVNATIAATLARSKKINAKIQKIADEHREIIRGDYGVLAVILTKMGFKTRKNRDYTASSLKRRHVICEGL